MSHERLTALVVFLEEVFAGILCVQHISNMPRHILKIFCRVVDHMQEACRVKE